MADAESRAQRHMMRPTPGCPTASTACAAALLLLVAPPSAALHAYGHAYSRPDDFTDAQIAQIASTFEVFTVEKSTAENVYGKKSSIAATVGTARRIKAINNSVQVSHLP